MSHLPDPYDVLRWAAVQAGDAPGYVLGCGETRVTILAQQIRALNLVWALIETGTVSQTLAIVGAGIAGCTAAVAASRRGLQVLLLEHQPEILAVQTGCTQRWVHPHLLDWPNGKPFEPNAGLPVMNWQTCVAGDLVNHLRSQFEREVSRGNIQLETVVHGIHVEPTGTIRFQSRNGGGSMKVEAVIYAVGFGIERAGHRYWSDSDLEQPQHGEEIVVSGGGDGALADVLRLRLGAAGRGATFMEWLNSDGQRLLEPFAGRVVEMERRLAITLHRGAPLGDRGALIGGDAADAVEAFSRQSEAEYPKILGSGGDLLLLHRAVLERLRADVSVVRVAPRQYDAKATPLHRFLWALLASEIDGSRLDSRLSLRLGRYDDRPRGSGEYSLADGTTISELADRRWILRHGPVSALQKHFAPLYDAVNLRSSAYGYAWPRTPLWPSRYFEVSR